MVRDMIEKHWIRNIRLDKFTKRNHKQDNFYGKVQGTMFSGVL